MRGRRQERGAEAAPSRGAGRGACSLPGSPGLGTRRGARAASREEARAWRRGSRGGADPGPTPSGAPCPTHPLPGARGRSRGRRRPTARPSCRPGGDGRGRKCAAAVSARGRSRTRRRSTLGGAHPALRRRESRHWLETPSLAPGGSRSCFPAGTSSLGRMVAGTREDRAPQMKMFTVPCFLFVCFVFCLFSNESVVPDTYAYAV